MTYTRREFVTATATAGGLLFLIPLPGCVSGSAAPSSQAIPVGVYVRIHPDGRVTILTPKIEMGQGTFTSLPMIIAEELDVAWDDVRVEYAPVDRDRYRWQGAGGSTSVWESWDSLRAGGARARAMIVAAAAARWGVPTGDITTRDGRVLHEGTNRSLGYAELAEEAAAQTPPAEPMLKAPEHYRIIGQPVRAAGLEAIVTGRESYSSDTRRDGAFYAVVARGPLDGVVAGVNDTAARAVPGVRDVVRLDRSAHQSIIANGVAVIADATWPAIQASRLLEIEWQRDGALLDTDAVHEQCVSALNAGDGEVLRDDGDVEQALRSAARLVEAEYQAPLLAHACMEPGNCFADVGPDYAIVRGPFQNPWGAQDDVANVLGLDRSQVTVEPARLGGGFGRRLPSDYAAEAVALAREVGEPLHLVWTREDDIRYDNFRPISLHRLRAGLDADGRLTAFHHRKAGTPVAWSPIRGRREARRYEIYPDDPPAGLIPNVRVEYAPVESGLPLGTWRSVVHSANGFVMGAFFDELAAEAGVDPVAFQQSLFGGTADLPYRDHGGPVFSPRRYLRVLDLVAERGGWGSATPPGRGRGIAAHFTFGSYAAQMAEVSVAENGVIRVHRVVAAIDCGIPVHPEGIRAQVESGIVYGLSAALWGEITVREGLVEQSNFHDYPVLRMNQMPDIEVHIVPAEEPPKGTGETSTPPIAAAVANAVYAVTGKRLRRPPFTPERVRDA
jgi:isoquinoline 1-oxidoreductase beta subunit